MIRVTLFGLLLLPLAQILPDGCPMQGEPPTTTPEPVDRRPIETSASASPDRAATDEMVELTASVANPSGVSFSWFQVSGPGARLTNADSATARFSAPSLREDATLRFMVSTTNAAGDVGRATVDVLVLLDDTLPFDPDDGSGPNPGDGGTGSLVARAGVDQQVRGGDLVTLDASGSRGTGLSFRWRQVGGPMVQLIEDDSAMPSFVAPAESAGLNTVEFEVIVTDNKGASDTDRVLVRIMPPGGDPDDDTMPQVRLVTNFGNIVLELNPAAAPITVENFLQYVDEGFYTNTLFHRVVPGFVVQGGGFLPGLTPKDTRDPIALEADNGLQNDQATVGMARTNAPNSATSQFYINLVDNDSLNADTQPPGFAVFGRVVEGFDIVTRIAAVATESRDGFMDVPVNDVLIRRAERVTPEN